MQMKKLWAIAATSFFCFSATAHELTVKVEGITSIEGYLYVALHKDAETWMTDKQPLQGQKLPVSGKTMRLVFKDLPDGDYGVTLYQDKNDNGKIDINASGIPVEPYGFSLNGGSFGPPAFDSSKVKVAADTETTIYLQ
jgi:uncharacterized protein (DUF2141 family)